MAVPLRVVLIALAVAAALFIPGLAALAAAPFADAKLTYVFAHHAVQAVLSVAAIGACKAIFTGADFGLRLPNDARSVWQAALWSTLVAALFTFIRYIPNIASGQAPPPDYPLTAESFAGWIAFEGVFVGPTEEILFRSLILGLLLHAGMSQVRIGVLQVSRANLIAAVIFAAAHYGVLGPQPWYVPAFQMTYAFVLGLIYGHWFEKSRSLLAPALAHNASDLFATLVSFGAALWWR